LFDYSFIYYYAKSIKIINFLIKTNKFLIGDWGLGIGDWGLGIGPNPQSPFNINYPKINLIKLILKYLKIIII